MKCQGRIWGGSALIESLDMSMLCHERSLSLILEIRHHYRRTRPVTTFLVQLFYFAFFVFSGTAKPSRRKKNPNQQSNFTLANRWTSFFPWLQIVDSFRHWTFWRSAKKKENQRKGIAITSACRKIFCKHRAVQSIEVFAHTSASYEWKLSIHNKL